jgi:alanine racemase
MSLHARVSFVKRVPAGTGVSYGLRYTTARETTLATVPVGYADGVPRLLGAQGGEVLIRGKRYPIAGTITMDQLMVDVGDAPVVANDEVVLLGEQGSDAIDVWEWAERTDTIGYEIVTRIGQRVPRIHR